MGLFNRARKCVRLTCGVLGLLFMGVQPAAASVVACERLATVVQPSDLKLAYNFAVHHGECIADFDDPTFQAIAAGLTSLILTGAITPGTCSSLLSKTDSPAAQQISAIAGVGFLNAYLDCGCAVATSGVADRLKQILADMKSCAATFDPSADIEKGLNAAGTALGFSTLWGLEGNGEDPRAGVGNGGAPVTDTICGWGSWYPDNGTCTTCQGPDTYRDPVSHPNQLYCLPCSQGQALQNGVCAACPDLGPNTTNVPDMWRSQCLRNATGSVTNPCRSWQRWNAADNSCTNICGPGQAFSFNQTKQTMQCFACQPGSTLVDNQCRPCPPNARSTGGGACVACPPGTQRSSQGDMCLTFTCGANAVIVPGHANTCALCPSGTHASTGGDQCVNDKASCGPNAIQFSSKFSNVVQCGLCPAGEIANAAGAACIPAPRALPRLPMPMERQ